MTGRPIRFTTRAAAPAAAGQPSVEDVYASVTRMNIYSATETPLDVSMSLRLLPGISVASVITTPYRIERTHAQTIDGNDDFVLTIARRTSASGIVVRQGGREVSFEPGRAGLWMSDEKIEAIAPTAADLFNITIPRRLVIPVAADLDRVLREGLPASPELALLANYAEGLTADTPMSPELATLAGAHIRDLVVAALGVRPGRQADPATGGIAAARLDAVKRDVLAHLADPALSIDVMAARHRISPHYIRALFNRDGTAFTDYLREQRLQAAFRRLAEPALAHHSISAIAYGCGFNDLSWFNAAFKRRFGTRPSDARRQAAEARARR